ncbi:MAG: DNA polymerase [Clostridia bacterium]|nr:DNA polymerase [Clostridia bacterium]
MHREIGDDFLADKRRLLSIDLETFSDVDLAKCGVYRYVEGDFHILLFAYAFDNEETKIVDLACGEKLPQEVVDAIFDDSIIKAAWNAQFERTCLSKYFNTRLSPDSWQCSMVWAASLSLPLKLKTAAEVLKTGEQKDDAGERLIKYFSVPCKPTKSNGGRTRNLPEHAPEDWTRFKEYCRQDVRTERAIRKRLEKFPLPDSEWDHYHMDQRINDRGVMIDKELVTQAITCDLMLSEEMTKRAYALTGLENPNSVSQLKGWLEERGIEVSTLGKKDVSAMITDLDKHSVDGEALEMMKLRLQMAKSSVKKYQAADRYICSDGRAHGLFQFSGANRTQRWAGRGIQLQNLPQNHIATLDEARELVKLGCFNMVEGIYGNTPDILSQLIRTMLIPKPGCEFIIADFSAIEARVLAWLAGEQWRIDAFKRGDDIYCASASQMFGVPVVKHGINGELRQKGKVAELACGYGGGAGALISMGALDMGLKESELPNLIDDWRNSNPNITKFWYAVEKAAVDTIKDHQERTVDKIGFQFYANTLWLVLPSGRKLAYIKPRLQPNRFGRMAVTFEGLNAGNKWVRSETYSGKLVENITQATARDLLAEAMRRMELAGLEIVAHVHDEVIIEAPVGSTTVEDVCSIMNQNPPWAEGLPLSSAGYKGVKFYYKD